MTERAALWMFVQNVVCCVHRWTALPFPNKRTKPQNHNPYGWTCQTMHTRTKIAIVLRSDECRKCWCALCVCHRSPSRNGCIIVHCTFTSIRCSFASSANGPFASTATIHSYSYAWNGPPEVEEWAQRRDKSSLCLARITHPFVHSMRTSMATDSHKNRFQIKRRYAFALTHFAQYTHSHSVCACAFGCRQTISVDDFESAIFSESMFNAVWRSKLTTPISKGTM